LGDNATEEETTDYFVVPHTRNLPIAEDPRRRRLGKQEVRWARARRGGTQSGSDLTEDDKS